METSPSIKAIIIAVIISILGTSYGSPMIVQAKNNHEVRFKEAPLQLEQLEINNDNIFKSEPTSIKIEIDVEELRQIKIARQKALELQRQKEEEERKRAIEEAKATQIVYDGLTYNELVAKLNRSLNSSLSGQGESFVKYSLELGLDPYLAVAIVLHETGCKWNCSSLLRNCNNVGGMKGSPGCNGGSYKAFPSLDEGIKAYMYNLYNNYYSKGLTTPEAIGPKYAASTTWASKVRNYMNEIRAN